MAEKAADWEGSLPLGAVTTMSNTGSGYWKRPTLQRAVLHRASYSAAKFSGEAASEMNRSSWRG